MSAMRTNTENAISRVSHLKARSPKRKPDVRNPKAERRPKSEIRKEPARDLSGRISDFGFRPSDFISPSVLDRPDPRQHPVPEALRQRRVIQRRSHAFAFRQRPIQELGYFLSLGGIFLLLINRSEEHTSEL